MGFETPHSIALRFSAMSAPDPDLIARLIHQQLYGHMEHRVCTRAAPMPLAQAALYRWSHPDATVLGRVPFSNAVDLCRCPNCGLEFTSFPRLQ